MLSELYLEKAPWWLSCAGLHACSTDTLRDLLQLKFVLVAEKELDESGLIHEDPWVSWLRAGDKFESCATDAKCGALVSHVHFS